MDSDDNPFSCCLWIVAIALGIFTAIYFMVN